MYFAKGVHFRRKWPFFLLLVENGYQPSCGSVKKWKFLAHRSVIKLLHWKSVRTRVCFSLNEVKQERVAVSFWITELSEVFKEMNYSRPNSGKRKTLQRNSESWFLSNQIINKIHTLRLYNNMFKNINDARFKHLVKTKNFTAVKICKFTANQYVKLIVVNDIQTFQTNFTRINWNFRQTQKAAAVALWNLNDFMCVLENTFGQRCAYTHTHMCVCVSVRYDAQAWRRRAEHNSIVKEIPCLLADLARSWLGFSGSRLSSMDCTWSFS